MGQILVLGIHRRLRRGGCSAKPFSESAISVETHGNVLAATAFLYGIALEELRKEELDFSDPDYEVTIAVRAVKEAE